MGPRDFLLFFRLGRLGSRLEELLWLGAAVRSGVLDTLAGRERTAGEVARSLGGPADLADAFLAAGAACGWVRASGGRYRLSRRGARLVSNPCLRACVLYGSEVHGRHLLRLPETLRGRTRPALEPAAGPIIAEVSRLALPYAVKALVRAADLRRAGVRLLDVGCGTADYLCALCGRFPRAQGLGIDLDPGVVSLASDRLQQAGLSGRVQVRVGDIRDDPLDPPYTLILANHILHYFPEDGRAGLVARLAAMLEPGGRLAVQQLVQPAGRTSRLHAFLNLFFAAHAGMGRLPTAEQVLELERGAGLVPEEPRRVAGLRTLLHLIARKA